MKKYRNRLLSGVFIATAIYIVYLFLADSQLGDGDNSLRAALGAFNWSLLPWLVFTQCLVILFRFIEWQYYLGVIGARSRISVSDSFVLFVSCFVLVISPGKAAEVLKSVLLKAKTGIAFARSVPIVLAERIIDGLAVIILMSLALVLASDLLSLGVYEGVDYGALSRVITFSSLAVILGGLVVVQIRPLAYAVLGFISRLPLLRRASAPLTTFYESSREIFQLRHVLPMTVVGTGVYFASALCFILVLHGFGLEISWTMAMHATFIVGVTSAIGALSFVPNGAGITEISTTGMLLAMVAPHEPLMTPAVAAAASLIQGFFHKWLRVFIGLFVAVLFRRRLLDDNVSATLNEYERLRYGEPEAGTSAV
jgi:uncharacterized protein (TIRG00374 family)